MYKAKYISIAIASLLLFTWLFLAINHFKNQSFLIDAEENENDLYTISVNNANIVKFIFNEFGRSLSIAARGIEDNLDKENTSLLFESFNDIANEAGFISVTLDSPSDTSYASSGQITPTDNTLFMQNSQIAISDAYFNEEINESVIAIRLPMRDSYEGFHLRALVTISHLEEIFDAMFFTSDGYCHIMDKNGSFLSTASEGMVIPADYSYLKELNLLQFDEGYSQQDIKDSFSKKTQGLIKYSIGNSQRYLYYLPIGINDWVMATVQPKEKIEKITERHGAEALELIITVLVIIGIALIIVFNEITKTQTATQIMQTAIQSLARKTNKAIIEWDYTKNNFSAISDYTSVFGTDVSHIDIKSDIKNLRIFHNDDFKVIRMIFEAIEKGISMTEIRFRIKHTNGNFIWCEYSSTVIKNKKGKPLKSFAFIEDIDADVKKTAQLQKNAEIDLLTQVYNKAQTEVLISHELANLENKTGALFILDFDNFKQLNDTFGHQKGDEALKETASGLKKIFRSDDIIGRIGGDEFFIYLKSIDSIETIKHKADTICKTLKKTYSKNKKSVTITYSIGISLAPNHAEDLPSLYKLADKALYEVKSKGKDGFSIYNQ